MASVVVMEADGTVTAGEIQTELYLVPGDRRNTVSVRGDTYERREELKGLGLRWNPGAKSWDGTATQGLLDALAEIGVVVRMNAPLDHRRWKRSLKGVCWNGRAVVSHPVDAAEHAPLARGALGQDVS